MFVNADPENNWIRVPVVSYLRACPLPEAEKALEKLEELDPDAVRRANTFFSIPVQKESTESKSSAVDRAREELEREKQRAASRERQAQAKLRTRSKPSISAPAASSA